MWYSYASEWHEQMASRGGAHLTQRMLCFAGGASPLLATYPRAVYLRVHTMSAVVRTHEPIHLNVVHGPESKDESCSKGMTDPGKGTGRQIERARSARSPSSRQMSSKPRGMRTEGVAVCCISASSLSNSTTTLWGGSYPTPKQSPAHDITPTPASCTSGPSVHPAQNERA